MTRFAAVLMLLLVMACDGLRLTPERELVDLAILPADTTAVAGDILPLRLMGRDQNGEYIDVPAWRKIRWIIGNTEVLEPTSDGKWVTTLAQGESKITATVAGLSTSARVRVNPLWEVTASHAYITQAAQNPFDPIPIVANRHGMLRIFLTLDGFHTYSPPDIHLTLFNEQGALMDTVLTQSFPEILQSIDESRFGFSYNLHVSGEHVQPGLKLSMLYDPSDEQRGIAGSELIDVEVREMPVYQQMIMPILMRHRLNDKSAVEWANWQKHDGTGMKLVRMLHPVSDYELRVREPYITDINIDDGPWREWLQLANEADIIRRRESLPKEYWYGVVHFRCNRGCVAGLGLTPGKWAVGFPNDGTLVHEIGHNMSLNHAPCGGAGGPDRNFPHPNGSIGYWGWKPDTGELLDPSKWRDIMGYCRNDWISSYHFNKARAYRERHDQPPGGIASHEPTLIVWGSVDDLGDIALEPSLALDMPPSVPDGGSYVAEGFDANGEILFSHRFTPNSYEHMDAQSFALAIPYDVSTRPEISSITVSGLGSSMTITESSLGSISILIDERTDRISAIRRNWTGVIPVGTRASYSRDILER